MRRFGDWQPPPEALAPLYQPAAQPVSLVERIRQQKEAEAAAAAAAAAGGCYSSSPQQSYVQQPGQQPYDQSYGQGPIADKFGPRPAEYSPYTGAYVRLQT